MKMHNPAHPGEVLRELHLDPLGISVTDAAKKLGVTRQALSNLLNGKTSMSIEMAVRLAKATGSSAEFWLRMQMQRDLWQADRRPSPRVMKLAA